MGPLLLLVYFNDMLRLIKYPMIMFADDCIMLVQCEDTNGFKS